jgi:hypothetical protein
MKLMRSLRRRKRIGLTRQINYSILQYTAFTEWALWPLSNQNQFLKQWILLNILVGLLGRGISPSQSHYLHRTAQHKKVDMYPCQETGLFLLWEICTQLCVCNVWSLTTTPTVAFMAWCLGTGTLLPLPFYLIVILPSTTVLRTVMPTIFGAVNSLHRAITSKLRYIILNNIISFIRVISVSFLSV